MMKIAVFVNANGQAISFHETGVVKLYGKGQDGWKVVKDIVFGINMEMSFPEIREKMKSLTDALDDCKIMVAAEIKGVPLPYLRGWALPFGR